MAKIERHKDEEGKELDVNFETGDITAPVVEAWSNSLSNSFVKVCSLIEQIQDTELNVVDETNLTAIAYAFVPFGEKGKNLLEQVCLYQTIFSTADIQATWEQAMRRSKAKTGNAFVRLCKAKGLEAKTSSDTWEYKIKEPGKPLITVTDEITEEEVDQLRQYSFLEKDNCYYFAEYNYDAGICTLIRKSNFILRILFHIQRGKNNKRVIELVNIHHRKVTMDIETKQLTSFQGFKELTEGSGNFTFEGTSIDLQKIKNKLFEEELPSQQIDMLGWNKRGEFFAFANGIFNSQFHPVDEHGIVTLHKKNYFIPYHPNTEELTSVNEKLFSYKPGTVSFLDWASMYCTAFGDTGRVALLFGIATLFSDHIFAVRRNFPMLFLYGEGGSGKSRVGAYLQYLWGEPQPPLKLSDKANTDKARIRKMAQYINAMALFEEFINELDMNIIKTITGIYDRFGYERSNMNSMYGTETVPINSTAFITGNSYPNDDPLMQRLIMIDYHKNIRDDKTVSAYNKLTQTNREGLTHLTGWLLQYRDYFCKHYEDEFDSQFQQLKKLCAEKQIIVPDRMCENYALILTTFGVITKAGVSLPFKQGELETFMLSTIQAQSEKRDVGSVTQRFWDIFLALASEAGAGGKPTIRYNKEYTMDGNSLFVRWTEVHGLYMEKHSRIYRSAGMGKSTMLQKLKDSGQMVTTTTKWIDGNTRRGYEFDYNKLGIDLISVIEYWNSQEWKYATDEPQNVRNVRKSEESTDSDENEQKGLKQARIDELPF